MRATSGMDNPPSSTAATTRTRNSVGYGAIRLLCPRSQAFASRYKVVWNLRLHAGSEGPSLIFHVASHSSILALRSWHTLIHTPAPAHRPLALAELLFHLRRIL